MFKKILAIAGLVVPVSVNAAIISYNGYSHETNSNIVTGGNLEWLQWDETVGLSINDALSAHSGDGWRMATLVEMAKLFNDFDLGNTFLAIENNTRQEASRSAAPGLLDTLGYDVFVDIFGRTDSIFNSVDKDPQRLSEAHFGTDENNDFLYGRASVKGDYQLNNSVDIDAEAWFYGQITTSTADRSLPSSGVALVRAQPSVSNPGINAVPVPSTIWLFGLAFAGMIGFKRKKQREL